MNKRKYYCCILWVGIKDNGRQSSEYIYIFDINSTLVAKVQGAAAAATLFN